MLGNFRTLFFVFAASLPSVLTAQTPDNVDPENLYKLSLEQLSEISVTTGSLSSSSYRKSIAPITVISREQIEISQARNIATLLEVYVPGMLLMAHQEGEKIGIRGLIAAENYQFLLLVNGRNMTNTVYEGALLELDLWDLNDIEKVEVLRGPGSVTYGTGAIAGVINIITKTTSSDHPKISTGAAFDPVYGSIGGNFQVNQSLGDFAIYGYGSIRKSSGFDNPDYYIPEYREDTDVRFVGKSEFDEYGPEPYLADALGRPQLKAHVDLTHNDDFRAWARYTQSGQTHVMGTQRPLTNEDGSETVIKDPSGLHSRSFAFSPEYILHVSDRLNVKTNFTYHNQEYIRFRTQSAEVERTHFLNIKDYAFSQARTEINLLADFHNDRLNIVGGYQFNRLAVRHPWGTSSDHLWIREGVNILNDTLTSVYYNDPNVQLNKQNGVVEVGNGIFANTHSLLAELSFQLTDRIELHHSSRLDFPDLSTTMYSPRLAVITELNKKNVLKISGQRSLRMMPLRAQYLFDRDRSLDSTSNSLEHESLRSIELEYLFEPRKNLFFDLHTFYNDIDAVGYTGQDLQILGTLQLLGIELETNIQWGTNALVFNHSWLNLLGATMSENLKTGSNRNNITFADYYYFSRGDFPLLLEGYGQGLNNISNNTTRLIFTKKMLDKKLILHANARVFWDYEGSYDEMRMYKEAYDNYDLSQLTAEEQVLFEEQRAIFEKEKELLEEQNAFRTNFRLNLSVSYRWRLENKTEVLATLYADNPIGSKVKYYVSTGSVQYYPDRLRFLLEPRTVGIRVQWSLR